MILARDCSMSREIRAPLVRITVVDIRARSARPKVDCFTVVENRPQAFADSARRDDLHVSVLFLVV